MRVLLIAPDLPYPISSGGNVALVNTLRALTKLGAHTTLLSFGDEEAVYHLEQLCPNIRFVAIPQEYPIKRILRHPGKPYWVASRFDPAFVQTLNRLIDEERVDLVQIEHLNMGIYASHLEQELPVTLTVHSLTNHSFRRIAQFSRNLLIRAIYAIEAIRLKRYEEKIFRNEMVARYFFYSIHDIAIVKKIIPKSTRKIVLLPLAVESKKGAHEKEKEVGDKRVLLLIGSMYNPSNEDAARWFAEEIFPVIRNKVPEAEFWIVGRGSKEKLGDIEDGGTTVFGEVEDLEPYLQKADICVVPQRGGAGIRVKLLDSMAAGKIVVATPVGVEAIPSIKDGVHFLLAKTAQHFAERCIDVLRRPDYFREIGKNANNFIKENYSLDVLSSTLVKEYKAVLQEYKAGR